MTNSRFYSSTAAVTSLQVTANPGDASIQVASSSGWPSSFPFTVSLDYGSANEELVDVTGGGPSVFTVTRAVDGTSASTHNAGAVARHVSSARDFTDSRTHEASSTSVHGITGAFVDTASVQTLSNKTLNAPTLNNPTIVGTATATGATITGGTYTSSTMTSPTLNTPTVNSPAISGGSVTGTVTGSPTLSGNPTFSGTVNTTGTVASVEPASTSLSLTTAVTGDAQTRYQLQADGVQRWGAGSGATDVSLGRSGAGFLSVSGSLAAGGSLTANGNLLGADLSLSNPVFTTFVPAWHGHDASMNTNAGWYYKVGKMVFYEIYTVFSSSSSLTGSVSVDLPTTPFRSGLRQQMGTVWYTDVAPGGSFPDINCMGHHCTAAGDSGVSTQPLKNYRDNTFTGGLIVGPSPATIITINGMYREA